MFTFENNISFDCDLAQIYFDDFKQEIENQSLWFSGRNGTDYLVIFENENLKNAPYYKKSHLAKMTKQGLYDLCEEYDILGYCQSEYEFEDNTKQTLIDELMCQVTNEKFYTKHYEDNHWHDLDCDFTVRGNHQGDACKVNLIGKTEKWLNEDYLENTFYNTPLDGSITVYQDGDEIGEIYTSELVGFDCYDYMDKEDFIKLVTNQKALQDKDYFVELLEYLESELPEYFKYSY